MMLFRRRYVLSSPPSIAILTRDLLDACKHCHQRYPTTLDFLFVEYIKNSNLNSEQSKIGAARRRRFPIGAIKSK